jgi:AraC-like DNA-binding protein
MTRTAETAAPAVGEPLPLDRILFSSPLVEIGKFRVRRGDPQFHDSGPIPRGGVTDVALSLGFSSHSHFTAAFRKEYGGTPREIRRASGHRSTR